MRTLRFILALFLLAGASSSASQGSQPAPSPGDPLSGDWSAVAYYDSEVPFSLSLKVDGAAVTGTVSTPEGSSDLRAGRWEEGTFSFETSYQGAPVAMSATIKDGKLTGSWSFNGGEATGRWEATRKAKS